jgi:hypothetical protein
MVDRFCIRKWPGRCWNKSRLRLRQLVSRVRNAECIRRDSSLESSVVFGGQTMNLNAP